jgi:hypothetical protein
MFRKLSLGVLLLALTACGGAATGTANDSTGAAPSAVASPAPSTAPQASAPASESSPAASIGNISGDFSSGDAAAIETRAISALASQINQAENTLKLVSREATEWSDGSLGCPAEGMMYTQALVPGFKLTYNDGSRNYDVHTDADGQRAILCDNGQPTEITQP